MAEIKFQVLGQVMATPALIHSPVPVWLLWQSAGSSVQLVLFKTIHMLQTLMVVTIQALLVM